MSLLAHEGFSEKLLQWWEDNRRDFPWRQTRDPYRILVAEILLHRTKADQVAPIYTAFVRRFPNLKSLATASEDEVEKMLYPLGLRWRVRLLISMVREIADSHAGIVPIDRHELESLPGVSHYIASAVRSFGLDLPDPILDTNTVRILGRVFGVSITDSSRRSKEFRMMYESLMEKKRPRDFNFAMIDLAALLCRPTNPICHQCPIKSVCNYGRYRGGIS